MTYDTDMNIFALSPFEPNAMFATSEDPDTIRRFTTLLDCGAVGGGSHHLRKVANTEGETFALKTLWSLDSREENGPAVTPSGIKTLTEEYRNLAAVSLLSGFAKTYGYGYTGNTPAILMEWIEGLSLRDAVAELTDPAEGGRIPANTVAAIGKRLGEILLGAQKLDAPFAHRDISLRNIIIRTTRRPLAQQIAHCSFDLCLVDLGSSSIKRSDPSFTMSTGIWRNGTPEFAPPEMLSNDIPELAPLRTSPSIDTYELCSVLYTLYAGHTPYRLNEHMDHSPYLYKIEHEPEPLKARVPGDQKLVDIIMSGIRNEQSQRAPLSTVTGKLDAWIKDIDFEPRTPLPTPVDFSQKPKTASSDKAQTRHPAISRRAALALGGVCVAGIAASAISTGCWGLIDLSHGIKPSLDAYTWEELALISRKIQETSSIENALEIALTYHLVDCKHSLKSENTKTVRLSDGTKAQVQIVGFKADTLTDDGLPAGITFMFRTPIAMRAVNDSTATGGWEQSSLREWLAGEGMATLPNPLHHQIRSVRKLTNNTGATKDVSSITATDDKLWLPSMSELCGHQAPETFSEGYEYLSALYSGEGDQYQLYREQGVSGLTANDAMIRTVDGKKICYWERTPSADCSEGADSTLFNRVGKDGDVFSWATPGNKPDQMTYVLPGFCI